MKRVVLDHKTILAHGLTCDQAEKLRDGIRAREDLKPFFDKHMLWISNAKPKFEGDEHIWYLYIIDHDLKDGFMDDPERFVFELSGN